MPILRHGRSFIYGSDSENYKNAKIMFCREYGEMKKKTLQMLWIKTGKV